MRGPPPHEMVHVGTDAAGMEEWRCPVCGRHFIVRWPPDYERLLLAEGDPRAAHVGTRGEVGFSGIGVGPATGEPATGDGDAEDAWRRWLHEHGIDWDGETPEA
jgi:hypothetical protein